MTFSQWWWSRRMPVRIVVWFLVGIAAGAGFTYCLQGPPIW